MAGWPWYGADCRIEIHHLLAGGGPLTAYRANKDFGSGPSKGSKVYEMERLVEKRFGVKHAIGVSSGTAALHSILLAMDLKGGEVITSPFTFSATAAAILHAGGLPVFADVDPHTCCLTPEGARQCLTRRTKAILPVHLFGHFAPLDEMEKLGVPIIEDACQAVGASRDGRYSGSVGIAGAYSFNGAKNIPAGEGGCVVTNDSKIAEKVRLFINHQENFGSKEVGHNYRMHELVAVLVKHGLLELDDRNKRRRELAGEFNELKHAEMMRRVSKTYEDPEGSHVFYVYPFLLYIGLRGRFIKRCAKQGLKIGAGYITPPLHHYPAFRRYVRRPLPIVDELSSKMLCLISDFTPDKPISYARWVVKVITEALECE